MIKDDETTDIPPVNRGIRAADWVQEIQCMALSNLFYGFMVLWLPLLILVFTLLNS